MGKLLTGAVASALIVGCAATGVKISDAQLATLRKGESTVDQVTTAFGPPTSRTRVSNGTSILQYVYSEARTRAATFIPIVGAFAGGMDVRSNVAILEFDAGGKLISVSSSETQQGMGMGLSSGQTNSQQVPQPRQ